MRRQRNMEAINITNLYQNSSTLDMKCVNCELFAPSVTLKKCTLQVMSIQGHSPCYFNHNLKILHSFHIILLPIVNKDLNPFLYYNQKTNHSHNKVKVKIKYDKFYT